MRVRSATEGCTRGGADATRRVKEGSRRRNAPPSTATWVRTGAAVLPSACSKRGASQDQRPAWPRRASRALDDSEESPHAEGPGGGRLCSDCGVQLRTTLTVRPWSSPSIANAAASAATMFKPCWRCGRSCELLARPGKPRQPTGRPLDAMSRTSHAAADPAATPRRATKPRLKVRHRLRVVMLTLNGLLHAGRARRSQLADTAASGRIRGHGCMMRGISPVRTQASPERHRA